MPVLEKVFWGNSVQAWLVAIGVAIVFAVVVRVARSIVGQYLSRLARKTETEFDDWVVEVLGRTKGFVITILAIYVGSHAVALPERLQTWLHSIAVITFLIQIAFWLDAVLVLAINSYQKRYVEDDASRLTTIRSARFIARLILYSIVLMLALDNIPGVEITTLIASLGIGGIAVALAVQNVLADLFASLSITLDKPFVIGDFIIVGEFMGTVENIGLKTTRIRSLSGEQLIFSNNDLLGSRIRNYKRMSERRIIFSLGVTYQTSREKLERVPGMIRQAIEAQEQTRFDRSHFKQYGDFALVFEAVYYMLVPDYNAYMDTQQAINLAIHGMFEKEGIEFAYPTQTVYIARAGGELPGPRVS